MMKSIGLTVALAAAQLAAFASAATPPLPDALTENTASSWSAAAQSGTASVANDSSKVKVGARSIRFLTNGGFDTWLLSPPAKNAAWDLLANGAGGLRFWVYSDNPNSGGFQNGSPWIRLFTSTGNYIELRSGNDVLNSAEDQWVQLEIPYNGSTDWTKTVVGSPNLSSVNWIEIHADTWGGGFTLWFDGMSFDLPLPPPQGLAAIVGNHNVDLSWDEFPSGFGTFDHYAIYRDTAPFSSVASMKPIGTTSGLTNTSFNDRTAKNGTSYYYAVTAVMTNGFETTEVDAVGPRTPFDETDLQVVSISRTPRFPRYEPTYEVFTVTEPGGFGPYTFSAATGLGGGQNANTKRWPDIGETVTYTATVRNRGTNVWSTTLTGSWTVDGNAAGQNTQGVNLAPGETTTFTLAQTWDGQSHEVGFSIDARDARPQNNARSINSKSVAFLSYADLSYMEDFREESASVPNAINDDLFDWLNQHMDRFNELYAGANCAKRVHFDVLESTMDGTPDPAPPDGNCYAIFPFRYHAGEGSLRLSGYYDPNEDLDYGLLHEMGHQLGLIDLYRLDLDPAKNQITGTGYTSYECLMNGCSHFISPDSAGAMDLWLDKAHGYFGQYLYSLPNQIRVRFLNVNGQPLANANVTVYQKCDRPDLGETVTNQIKFQGVTGPDGIYTLPNVNINPSLVPTTFAGDSLKPNPFGYVACIGTNGLLLLKVEKDTFADYAWLDITDCNVAFFQGQTDIATFDRQTVLGGPIQHFPPIDMAELNAASWDSWAQEGKITLSDDSSQKLVGGGSVKVDTTGGFDNYVRYPGDVNALWDLSAVTSIHMWCFAINPNNPDFQGGSPWVRLGNADGYFEWHPPTDVLNQAIGQWKQFIIPIAGNGTWLRTTVGTPDLEAINYLEVHADTWGGGFTLWLDGVGFTPAPQPQPGDVDSNGVVDVDDLLAVINDWGVCDGPCAADLTGNGIVDVDDLLVVINHWT